MRGDNFDEVPPIPLTWFAKNDLARSLTRSEPAHSLRERDAAWTEWDVQSRWLLRVACVQDRISIENFTSHPRSVEVLAAVDRIFFEASGTKTFASETERAEFHERWLGRYLIHDPQWAYLTVTDTGEVVGYLVGALDDPAKTSRFSDIAYFKEFAALTAKFPAQLHVNLAGNWRGRGIGGDLVEAFARDAVKAGAPGVHVVTSRGMRNIGFYSARGFSEVGHLDWNGRELVFLGRTLG